MIDIDAISEPHISFIPIHFDVQGHSLPLETFIETAAGTRAIIDSFNRRVFDNKLQYKLLVLPPNTGSFIAYLGLTLIAGWGVVKFFTASDLGKAFIKGLTKHEPEYWSERAGVYLRESTSSADKATGSVIADGLERTKIECQFETLIITESTKSFLQTEESGLRHVGITAEKFRDGYEARNKFYQACAADPEIRAIGFDETDDFPIKRPDFTKLQVALAPKEEELIDMPTEVGIATLKVTSPNWDKEDRKRPWKARDSHHHERHFSIEDERFWGFVAAQKLDPRIIDRMKVQWAYRGDKRSRARVLKVLEYNDQILGEALDDKALSAMLGAYNQISSDQEDLFGR